MVSLKEQEDAKDKEDLGSIPGNTEGSKERDFGGANS